jgi:hypothetical protein
MILLWDRYLLDGSLLGTITTHQEVIGPETLITENVSPDAPWYFV